MAKLSRVAKYEELRKRLQSNSETEVKSKELSEYESRLNQIDSSNFAAPKQYPTETHDPIHARREEVYEKTQQEVPPVIYPTEKPVAPEDNDFLNQYIKEVKEYNIEQGNAFSTNTDLNILHTIKGDAKPNTIRRPFDEQGDGQEDTKKAPTVSPSASNSPTADIPFIRPMGDIDPIVPKNYTGQVQAQSQTQTMTKTREDIANEVQNLMNSTSNEPTYNTNTLDQHLEADRTARQQLLNETTQMRAQLDDYEDNLTEVSDKMKHTNRILNFVLIVLIVALVVVLCVVVYWILMTKGVI